MATPGISLKDLMEKYNLSQDQLDVEVSDEHLREMSGIIDDPEIVGFQLGLTEPEMTAINRDAGTQERQRVYMLRKWKQKRSWRATYRELIEALLKSSRAEQARSVCELLSSSTCKC